MFSSVQGEGPDVGRSTLFVRLGGCDLRCRWCDSPHTWRPSATASLQRARGSDEVETVPNPVGIDAVVAAAERLDVAAHRFVSLTGGEPLLQPEAVGELARALRARGPAIHLETHGLEHEALARVVGDVDVVSMDWKLASDVRRASDPARGPVAPFDAAHRAFLEVARAAPRVVVKLVVTPASGDEEIDHAIEAVAAVHPDATLVLQPVTPFGAVKERPAAARMLALGRRAEARLARVLVLPQTHPLLGVR